MVRRRAANVSGAVIDENTGSSLYSRIGTTQRSKPCLRISAGRNVSSRFLSHACCIAACSRSVPKGRSAGGSPWAKATVGRATISAASAVRRKNEDGIEQYCDRSAVISIAITGGTSDDESVRPQDDVERKARKEDRRVLRRCGLRGLCVPTSVGPVSADTASASR